MRTMQGRMLTTLAACVWLVGCAVQREPIIVVDPTERPEAGPMELTRSAEPAFGRAADER